MEQRNKNSNDTDNTDDTNDYDGNYDNNLDNPDYYFCDDPEYTYTKKTIRKNSNNFKWCDIKIAHNDDWGWFVDFEQ